MSGAAASARPSCDSGVEIPDEALAAETPERFAYGQNTSHDGGEEIHCPARAAGKDIMEALSLSEGRHLHPLLRMTDVYDNEARAFVGGGSTPAETDKGVIPEEDAEFLWLRAIQKADDEAAGVGKEVAAELGWEP